MVNLCLVWQTGKSSSPFFSFKLLSWWENLVWRPPDVTPCNWLMSETSWHIIILTGSIWWHVAFDLPRQGRFFPRTWVQDLLLFHIFHSKMTNNLIICMLRHCGWSPMKSVWKVRNPICRKQTESNLSAFWCILMHSDGTCGAALRFEFCISLAFYALPVVETAILINILKLLLANPSRGDLTEINDSHKFCQSLISESFHSHPIQSTYSLLCDTCINLSWSSFWKLPLKRNQLNHIDLGWDCFVHTTVYVGLWIINCRNGGALIK